MPGPTAPLTGELNYIVNYFFNGCRTPWDVVIETAQEPAGEIALSLLMFGWEDIVKSFWRPKGLRQYRHGRKKRKKGKGGGLPQINDIIAEGLDPHNDVFGPLHNDNLKIWWELENTIERVSYTIMIWDLIETFAFKTIIGILDLKATQCEIPGRISLQNRNYETFNTGQLYDIPLPTVKYVEAPCHAYLYGAEMQNDAYYQVLVGITAQSTGNAIRPLTMRVLIDAAEGGGIYEKVVPEFGNEATESHIFSGIVKGPAFVNIQVGCNGAMYLPAVDIRCFHSRFSG